MISLGRQTRQASSGVSDPSARGARSHTVTVLAIIVVLSSPPWQLGNSRRTCGPYAAAHHSVSG